MTHRDKNWTPGPWFCGPFTSYRDGQVHGYYIQSHHLPVLAGTLNWPHNADANAHLIAAAPELVEALEDLVQKYRDLADEICDGMGGLSIDAESRYEQNLNTAHAALAKAYGETEED